MEFFLFFFNDTATTEIYTLSLHDALPISAGRLVLLKKQEETMWLNEVSSVPLRSEEHTSELQSLAYLVCRLLLEKKKKKPRAYMRRRCTHYNTSVQDVVISLPATET